MDEITSTDGELEQLETILTKAESYETFAKRRATNTEKSAEEQPNKKKSQLQTNQLKYKCLRNIVITGIAGFSTHIITELVASLANSLSPQIVKAITIKSYSVLVGCYLAPFVINVIGIRPMLCIGPLMSLLFIACFLQPNIILLATVCTLYGLAVGVFYVAALFNMMNCSFLYADMSSLSTVVISGLTNAYLWTMFSLSGLTGNLIASLHLDHYRNVTTPNNDFEAVCGNAFCPEYNNETIIIPPTQESLDILVYIMMAIVGVGFVIVLFCIVTIDELNKYKPKDTKEVWYELVSVLTLLKDIRMLLLIPVIVTHGMIQMYPDVDYTQGYVTCLLGVQDIGYVMVCTTGSSSLGSFISGSLGIMVRAKHIIIISLSMLIIIFVVMLSKNLSPDHSAYIYLTPAGIGFFDGLMRTQISSYTMMLLKEKADAVSSAYFILNILGHSLIFTWTIYICMVVKLALLIGLVTMSIIAIVLVDIYDKSTTQTQKSIAGRSDLIEHELQHLPD